MAPIYGSQYSDDGIVRPALIGNYEDDIIYGYEGLDVLKGEGGNDKMYGGLHNDTYYVQDAGDQVFEAASEGNDTVYSSISYTLALNVEKLILTGTTHINGTGNFANNELYGNQGDNTLNGQFGHDDMNGGYGNDTVIGGYGNDTVAGSHLFQSNEIDKLTGGSGADTFKMYRWSNHEFPTAIALYNDNNAGTAGWSSRAEILDFNKNEDYIALAGSKSNYTVAASPISIGSSAQDTAIYLKTSGVNELVAIVQDVSGLNLNSSYFKFVN
jgi:Ca2+-binding RTX toxin-like protein